MIASLSSCGGTQFIVLVLNLAWAVAGVHRSGGQSTSGAVDVPVAQDHCSSTDVSERTKPWTAQWIWQSADGPKNTWMCFRKTVEIDSLPSSALARIAVDSKYWLWINGKLAVFEGGLNRGPTPASGYYDPVDLKPFLRTGPNTVAILVEYWGSQGRNNVDSHKGGLLFEGDLGGITLRSDKTWKAKVHPAYGPTEPPSPSHLYAGENIGFDAGKDMPGWTDAGFDDADWPAAVEKGTPPCPPWNTLWVRPIPQWKDSGLREYVNADNLPKQGSGSAIVATLPYAAQVTPYFKINAASAGLKIEVRTDRYTVSGYNGHRTEYTTKAGVQEFEALDWQIAESVIYTIPAGVEILNLRYRETGYDCQFAGGFSCNDTFYNSLFEKARRTLYVCMRDNYMDCPDRERGQWIGDVCADVPEVFYCLDRKADLLTRKCSRDLILWQQPDGVLRGLTPGAPFSEFASQSLAAIGDLGILMTYYRYTGDSGIVVESYPAIRKYLALWTVNGDGTISRRSTWNDGGRNTDSVILETVWYDLALKAAAEMAALAGHPEDVADYQERRKQIADGFDRLYWRGDGYRSGASNDERANAMAVISGLAGRDKWPDITETLHHVRNASPYLEGFVYQAMFAMGDASGALARMKDRYTLMVDDKNCSTLWEQFQAHEPTSEKHEATKNHAWSGAPMISLCRFLAGIAPETPGFTTYHVLPQLGGLTNVQTVVPSIKGDIAVRITRNATRFSLDLSSPAKTTAIVGLPKKAFTDAGHIIQSIQCGTRLIWTNGKFQPSPGITWNGEDDAYYRVNVASGTWSFIVNALVD